jgi:hypothetical protein
VALPHEDGDDAYQKSAYWEYGSSVSVFDSRGLNIKGIDLSVQVKTGFKYIMEDFVWIEDDNPDQTLAVIIEGREAV